MTHQLGRFLVVGQSSGLDRRLGAAGCRIEQVSTVAATPSKAFDRIFQAAIFQVL